MNTHTHTHTHTKIENYTPLYRLLAYNSHDPEFFIKIA